MQIQKLLEVKNLTVLYSEKFFGVKNLSMILNSNEIIGIVGESGSGKSTFIRSLIGLLPSDATVSLGEIIFDGKNILNSTKNEWRQIRGNKIAMIFQDSASYFNPTKKIGSQFIESIRSHFDISRECAYKMASDMLNNMGMLDVDRIMNSYAFQLSGGMNQRIGIAMAMVMKPKILLADEPTSALDPTIQLQVVKSMINLKNNFNTSIIIVTHNIGVAAYMCDKIGVMHEGDLVEFGDKDQIISNPKSSYTKSLLMSIPKLGEV